jgi:hypothetical protein
MEAVPSAQPNSTSAHLVAITNCLFFFGPDQGIDNNFLHHIPLYGKDDLGFHIKQEQKRFNLL